MGTKKTASEKKSSLQNIGSPPEHVFVAGLNMIPDPFARSLGIHFLALVIC
jgi:hypothetical protein